MTLVRRHGFLVLKAANLVIITVYSFALIYLLIRILSPQVYPFAVLVSSLGVYIMATDLGYSGYVYFRTRRAYLETGQPFGAEAEVFVLYLTVAVASAVVMAVALACFPGIPAATRISLALYFLSIVLALPWALVRKIAAAVDLYLSFEFFELLRRLLFLLVATAMLRGLPFSVFCLICLGAWAAAYAVALTLLYRRRGIALLRSSARAVAVHLRSSYRNIWRSGSLTLIEFAIYNFPYAAIPMLFADRGDIIAFDIFYKVVRFGAVSYAVPAEALLPSQTRAFYAPDKPRLARLLGASLLIGAVPMVMAVVVILGFGDAIFTTLLSRGGLVGPPLRNAMAVMLVAMLFQNVSGMFLVATGNYGRLCRLALITLGLMATGVLACWVFGLSFQWFMTLYTVAYCLHALLYSLTLPRCLAGAGPPDRHDIPLDGRISRV